MQNLSERIAADGITLTFTTTERDGQRFYAGAFHFEGRTLAHDWSSSTEATLNDDVLSVLAPAVRFAATAEAADDYEDWAGDFSSDPAEWMPEETYTEWLEIAKNLRNFLGDDRFDAYAHDTEHDD